jgi:hypothetical protein
MERGRSADERRAIRLLRSYAGRAKVGPAKLSAEYLRAIARCEALPENQDGCDKTWVERSRRWFREHYARAKRIR